MSELRSGTIFVLLHIKMLNDFDQKTENRLKAKGLRATRHRIFVLSVLETSGSPMSHIELLQDIQKKDHRFDRVTLYRVLNALKETKLIHQVQGSDGIWRFCAHEADDELCPGGHPHLICEVCGAMTCLVGQKLPHIHVPDSFQVRHKQMVITGVCHKCQ